MHKAPNTLVLNRFIITKLHNRTNVLSLPLLVGERPKGKRPITHWVRNVCNLVPCSLLRDLLEHLHSPHWRRWEWDVAHFNSPSSLWPLQLKSRMTWGHRQHRYEGGHSPDASDVPRLSFSIATVTILTRGLKHQVLALLWYSWEQVLSLSWSAELFDWKSWKQNYCGLSSLI